MNRSRPVLWTLLVAAAALVAAASVPLQASAMADAMKDTPMYKSYASVAPRPHYELFLSPAPASTALPFLDGRSDSKSWAAQVQR